jgi:hypothetical protein
MPKHNIPVYAIVELLILLAQHDKSIGDYKGHTVRASDVQVKTTRGTIVFSQELIMRQFSEPEKITKKELLGLSSQFTPIRLRQRSA